MTKRTASAADAPTRFDNVTDAMLADELGAIDEELDAVKERQDEARREMVRRGKGALEGLTHTVLRAQIQTTTIDTAAIRKEMGDTWCSERSKPGTRTTYRIDRKGDVAEPIAEPEPVPAPAPARKPRPANARKAAALEAA